MDRIVDDERSCPATPRWKGARATRLCAGARALDGRSDERRRRERTARDVPRTTRLRCSVRLGARTRDHPLGREAQFPGPALPLALEHRAGHRALRRARRPRHHVRGCRIAARRSAAEFLLDVGASLRERLDHLARYALDLETVVPIRLAEQVSKPMKFLGKRRQVERVDPLATLVDLFVGHRAPHAVLVEDRVHNDAVAVDVRVELSRAAVEKHRREHLLAAHPDHLPGLRIPFPGIDEFRLDPIECATHGPLVHGHNPRIAAQQPHDRDRLRRRNREVKPRAVAPLAAPPPSQLPARAPSPAAARPAPSPVERTPAHRVRPVPYIPETSRLCLSTRS